MAHLKQKSAKTIADNKYQEPSLQWRLNVIKRRERE